MALADAGAASPDMNESPVTRSASSESSFKDAIGVLEDGFALVKQTDSLSWLIYVVGVGPFFVLLLYSVTYLSANPFASEYLFFSAFTLAMLYLWMHVCQSVFATRLLAITNLASQAPLRNLFLRACATQLLIAPLKLIAWPVALFLVIPQVAVTMFFQHSLVLEPSSDGRPWRAAREDARYAWQQAIWILILVAFFRATLMVNLYGLVFLSPALWKAFTGLEGTVTRSPGLLQNPTTLAAVCILSYIGFDPLMKAITVIRHFERRAAKSGDDLRLKLSVFAKEVAAIALLIFVTSFVAQAQSVAPQSTKLATRAITSAQMRSAIQESFRARSSVWNLPIIKNPSSPSKPWRFFDPIFEWLKRGGETVDRWLGQLDDFFRNLSRHKKETLPDKSKSFRGFNSAWVMFALFGLVLAAAVVWWRRRFKPTSEAGIAVPVTPSVVIDLENSNIRADERSGDEWLDMARRYRIEGNLRYALRALHLSILSALARQGLISITRGKSNGDYLRELQRRRKRLQPQVVLNFQLGLSAFEKSWYGTHAVSMELLDDYEVQATEIQSTVVRAGTLEGSI